MGAKREAESEPESEAEADAYYRSYGYSNLGYSRYAAPAAYSTYSTIARPAISYAARPIVSTRYVLNRYSTIARPASYSRGYYGKREAEADPEAEADALYSTYGNYGYSTLGYSTTSRPLVSTISRPSVSRSYVSRPILSPRYGINRYSTGYG